MSELSLKLERLKALMDARGAHALRIAKAGNLAWLTGGGDFLVNSWGGPIAEGLVFEGSLTILTNRIEAGRLADEELPEGVKIEAFDWYDEEAQNAWLKRRTGGANLVSDSDLDLFEARVPLLDEEIIRYRRLGERASAALTETLLALDAGLSEIEVAARTRFALEEGGLRLPVVLVAGQERLGRYRHPVPKGAPFGDIGLVVVCAEARGLIVSLSRMVACGKVPELNRERLVAVLEVERAMWDATHAGATHAEVLEAARRAYAQAGFPDAWQEHHQGGPAGYFARDFLVTPNEQRPLLNGVAYAWNPSLPHAKSEDTVLLGTGGLENLSFDPRWPSLAVGGRERPDILVL
jgi:Xaa-Pro dipeptidase